MNQDKIESILLKIIKVGVYVTLFTPLVLGPFGINFIEYPKAVFFRSVIEIVFACYISLILLNKKYLPKKSILFFSLLLFYAVMFIASIFGVNFYRSFFGDMPRGEGLIMHLHLLAFFVIITSVFLKREEWLNLFKVSVLVSGLSSLVALLQQTGIADFYTMDHSRLSGTMSNPDLFACYIVLSIFLTIFILVTEPKKNLKILWAFLIALNCYTLFFSGTRGSWVGFIFGLIIILSLNFFNLDHKKRIIIVVGILIFFALILFVSLNSHWINNISGGSVIIRIANPDLSGRTDIWGPTLTAIMDRPILGWGFESFAYVSDKYLKKGLVSGIYFDRPHNKVLEVLVYGGVVGFLSYLFIFSVIFYLIFKHKKVLNKNKNNLKISCSSILLALFACYFIQNIFAFDNIGTYILFFLVVGFINNNFSNPQLNSKESSESFNLSLPIKIIVFLATAWVVYEINLKPTQAAMCFPNFMVYENADPERALNGYEQSVSMNTFYDNDLRITYSDRLLYLMNNETSNNIKENIYKDLFKMKPFLYKDIAKNDEQINHLRQFIARIDEQEYLQDKNTNSLDEMEKILSDAISFNPNVGDNYQLMGELRILQNKYSEGEEYIKKARILDNYDDATLYKRIGAVYLKKGDATMTLKNFEKAIDVNYENKKKNPESTEISTENAKFIDYVAHIYCAINDIKDCQRIYNKGAEIYPEYANFFNQRFETIKLENNKQ
jgi:O-antigen ligase/tetratricopeptide (TPR) repeat protein